MSNILLRTLTGGYLSFWYIPIVEGFPASTERTPFVQMTNGGGKTEQERCDILTKTLGVVVCCANVDTKISSQRNPSTSGYRGEFHAVAHGSRIPITTLLGEI